MAVSPDGTKLYVANSGGNSVSVLDIRQSGSATTLTQAATIAVGADPIGLTVSPDGTRVYVACNDGTVSVIATDQNPYKNLLMLGAAKNGQQSDQLFKLTFTDGTQDWWYQTFSDWSSTPKPGSVPGEVLVNAGTQINQLGNETGRTANVYGYYRALPAGKTLYSVSLPDNSNVGILGMSLV